MKVSLKLANGATLEFDGDAEEFERISAFLAEPPESLTSTAVNEPSLLEEIRSPEQPALFPDSGNPLEPGAVNAAFERVGVRNDQERVTVIAQLAMDAGRPGADYETLHRLYTDLGLPKPANFPGKTLSNAKASGYVVPVKPGLWKTTYRGENFAHGHGRGGAATRRSTPRRKPSSNGGGEPD